MGGRDGAKGSGHDGDVTAEAAAVQACSPYNARQATFTEHSSRDVAF